MGIFANILEKLGFKKPEQAPAPAKPPVGDSRPAPSVTAAAKPAPKPAAGPAMPAYPTIHQTSEVKMPPQKIQVVDVVSKLEKLAATNPQKLNWKVSIVDLLKLLGIDSSLAARKELATELGCPADKMGDSASMNIWLHKTVLQKIADNGGNIPKELLD